jgi:2-oxo-4-hydroxy-4-carboxy-5-ureidoimidazoline decarboxylase
MLSFRTRHLTVAPRNDEAGTNVAAMIIATSVRLEQLNAAHADDFVAALAGIYEHSPWVAGAVAGQRPFASLASLNDAMAAAVRAAPPAQRLALIELHPDLAGKAARAGNVTAESKSEQGGAGLERLSDAEYTLFAQLSDAYRQTFHIPFIVCVRRHTKESILRQYQRRLQNTRQAELETALNEVFRIAALRLSDRVKAADELPVSGRLSTHVLDNHDGRPAQGVAVTLSELGDDGTRRAVVQAVTNHDGRTDGPLIGGRPIPIGRYELRFEIGHYYASRNVPTADPAFLQSVPIEFFVAEPEGHYHVPLLVTPWSFSTYRGS